MKNIAPDIFRKRLLIDEPPITCHFEDMVCAQKDETLIQINQAEHKLF